MGEGEGHRGVGVDARMDDTWCSRGTHVGEEQYVVKSTLSTGFSAFHLALLVNFSSFSSIFSSLVFSLRFEAVSRLSVVVIRCIIGCITITTSAYFRLQLASNSVISPVK